jgi:NAD(P)-dependent dehydrogenase (short-subunit alcohol dehydrogenase family)
LGGVVFAAFSKGSGLRLAKKVAVVMGGSFGWGRAASRRLAREGATVLIVDGDKPRVETACEEIRREGGRAEAIACEPDDFPALKAVAAQLKADGRHVDVLVTHYMRLDWHSVEDCEIDAFERVVRFNLVGPLIATKAFLPLLKESGNGSVIHIGSVDGLFGSPRVPSYSASKGGLVPLTHIMSYEFAPFNIRVNTIASAQTNQIAPADMPASNQLGFEGFPGAAYMKQLNDATPLKRFGTPEEWAGSIAFLASDDSAYVTGTVMVVDCGRTAITPGTP